MARRASTLLLGLLAAQGCTCGSKSSASRDDGVGAPTALASGATASPLSPPADTASFSAPIAAARLGGSDVVAGLVATAGVIRVMGMTGGTIAWTTDALRDVAWAPDAELRMQAAGAGIALLWRGPHGGKIGRTLVLLGPHGEAREQPVPVGSAFCATGAGVAWLDARTTGAAHVLARGWAEASPRPVAVVGSDRDPALVCGDHDVFVLGDGDDDLTAAAVRPGEPAARPAAVALRDADFGEDEEREHDAYTVGDDLGLVRVGASGAISLREIPQGAGPTPWRTLRHTIPADDDVVAVDGDADATVVVYTEDADAACPGAGATAESVHALRVVRKTGDESVLDLAPPDCDHAPGPFWIAASPSGPTTLAWVERRMRPSGASAPVTGAALRVLGPAGVQAKRLDQAADALVDAGCDERGCSLAALVRPRDGDGMQPGSIRVLAYP